MPTETIKSYKEFIKRFGHVLKSVVGLQDSAEGADHTASRIPDEMVVDKTTNTIVLDKNDFKVEEDDEYI